MDNVEILTHIDRLGETLNQSIGRLEKKIDTLDSKLEDVNERAIVNSASIHNIKEDILASKVEFTRQINILHKVIRNCKLDHEGCPAKIEEGAILKVKNWFYATVAVGFLMFIYTLARDYLK